MMALSTDTNHKPTRALYKRIYRAYVLGLSHAELREKFKCSQSTVERALDWCKKNGIKSILPEDKELTESTLAYINERRARLGIIFNSMIEDIENRADGEEKSKSLIVTEDNMLKISKEIRELDTQRLTVKGLIEHKFGISHDLSKISDEDLMKYIKEGKGD